MKLDMITMVPTWTFGFFAFVIIDIQWIIWLTRDTSINNHLSVSQIPSIQFVPVKTLVSSASTVPIQVSVIPTSLILA